MSKDALVASRFLNDDDDDQHICRNAQDRLKAAAKEGTLNHVYEPARFGNAGGLSVLEKLDEMPRLSMNALIFSSKLMAIIEEKVEKLEVQAKAHQISTEKSIRCCFW